jgi:glycosyltransferase involved in cell wall biosynthesis
MEAGLPKAIEVGFKPDVSIVIPYYNAIEYLVDCLDSLDLQTFTKWEAIVVDDASPDRDEAATVISKLDDPRITLVRHAVNRGPGAARNTGFKAAKSDLVLPLDSDDMLAPSFLGETIGIISNNTAIDCVFTDFQTFGASDEIWKFTVKDSASILSEQWIPGPGTLMRREVWERAGGYSEATILRHGNEDWEFWISAMEQGMTAFHHPRPLYLYRRRPDSRNVTTEKYHDHSTREYIHKRHASFFKRHGAGRSFKAEGYRNSAYAAFMKHEKLRTAYIAMRGWLLDPERWYLLKLAIKALLPACCVPFFQKKSK